MSAEKRYQEQDETKDVKKFRTQPGFVLSNDERYNVGSFFDQIIKEFQFKERKETPVFITVNHVVPTLPPFLEALQKIGRIAAVITKNSINDSHISAFIKTKYPVKEVERDKEGRIIKAIDFIKSLGISNNERLIIIDIGGYFSGLIEEMNNDSSLDEILVGIVEDTENGHKRYGKEVANSKKPIASVARSELKKTEDYNVGKSIVEASDAIRRKDSHSILERDRITLVLGFGKIGSSIAEHLRQKNVKEVLVYDSNDILNQRASSVGFKVASSFAEAISIAEVIYSATGSKALKGEDFFKLKDNVFISSVTSALDEMDISLLENSATETVIGHINSFTLQNGKIVNLLCKGNSVNFAFNGVNGPFIYSVQAALIVSASIMWEKQVSNTGSIQMLPMELEKKIAKIWLENFELKEKDEEQSNQVQVIWGPEYRRVIEELSKYDKICNLLINQINEVIKRIEIEKGLKRGDFPESLPKFLDDIKTTCEGYLSGEKTNLEVSILESGLKLYLRQFKDEIKNLENSNIKFAVRRALKDQLDSLETKIGNFCKGLKEAEIVIEELYAKRRVAEQKILHSSYSDTNEGKEFAEVIKQIKRNQSDLNLRPRILILSSLDGKNKKEISWLSSFINYLVADLESSGCSIYLGYKSISHFPSEEMRQHIDKIIFIGTQIYIEDLTKNQMVQAICNNLMESNSNSVIPVILTGDKDTSLPVAFSDSSEVIDLKNLSYVSFIKEVVMKSYVINHDNENYQSLWSSFESKYSYLSQGITDGQVNQYQDFETVYNGQRHEKNNQKFQEFLERIGKEAQREDGQKMALARAGGIGK